MAKNDRLVSFSSSIRFLLVGFAPWGLLQFHQNAHSDHLKSPNAISNSFLFGLACHLQYDSTLLQY